MQLTNKIIRIINVRNTKLLEKNWRLQSDWRWMKMHRFKVRSSNLAIYKYTIIVVTIKIAYHVTYTSQKDKNINLCFRVFEPAILSRVIIVCGAE